MSMSSTTTAEAQRKAQISALIDLTERYGFPPPIGEDFERRPGIPVPQMTPWDEVAHRAACQRNRCSCESLTA